MNIVVSNRRNLTPLPPSEAEGAEGVHRMRRGGARREVSARVTLESAAGDVLHEGWALNVSRGGVRAILEEKVELGQEFEVELGDASADGQSHNGRVVWLQDEPDGVIVGIEFLGLSGHMTASERVQIAPPSGDHDKNDGSS